MNEKSMTIIGFGRMGKEYAEIFSRSFDISIISSRDISIEAKNYNSIQVYDFECAVRNSKYIVIAIPLSALDDIVNKINKYVSTNTIVFDVCSAKVKAMESLSKLNCKYFGTHRLSEKVMAICGDIDYEISECLRNQDIEIRGMTSEEHDEWNSIIGMGHFLALALAYNLTDYEKSVLSQVGSGKKVLALADHVTSNIPVTFLETQIDNQYTKRNRMRLIKSLEEYDDKLNKGEFFYRDKK